MYRKVFISHASEDTDDAESIYNFLKSNHYEPWLDFKALKAGMQWDYEIEQALRKSDFVVILLSKVATNKRGYIQREIKRMDRYSEEKLSDDIYILPILIDDCDVPKSLSKYQYMKTSQVDFRKNLLDSLNFQREKYLETVDTSDIKLEDCIRKSSDYALKTPLPINYNIDYYVCRENSFFDADYINSFIERDMYDLIDTYRKSIHYDFEYMNGMPNMKHAYIDISNSINIHSSNLLSVSTNISEYLGGLHPNHYLSHRHFSLNPERTLSLRDFVIYEDHWKWLIDKAELYAGEDQGFLLDSIERIEEDHIDFYWDDKYLVINFMSVLPHACKVGGFLQIPKSDIAFKLKI